MRTTGATARKVLAGLFLGVLMTLAMAGVASAQSNSNSNANSNSNSNSNTASSSSAPASTTRSSTVAGRTTARTGIDSWIPLTVGGLVITVAIATRVGLSRAASRI